MKFKYLLAEVTILGAIWGWSGVRLIERFEVNPITAEDAVPFELRPTDVGCGDCYYSQAGKILFFPAWALSGEHTYIYGGPNTVPKITYAIAAIIGLLTLSVIFLLCWIVVQSIVKIRSHKKGGINPTSQPKPMV